MQNEIAAFLQSKKEIARLTFPDCAQKKASFVLGKDKVISSTLISSSRKALAQASAFSALFARFLGVSPSGGENGRPHPFSQILRKDAVLFCSLFHQLLILLVAADAAHGGQQGGGGHAGGQGQGGGQLVTPGLAVFAAGEAVQVEIGL